jgi:hypothetical protein
MTDTIQDIWLTGAPAVAFFLMMEAAVGENIRPFRSTIMLALWPAILVGLAGAFVADALME